LFAKTLKKYEYVFKHTGRRHKDQGYGDLILVRDTIPCSNAPNIMQVGL